MELDNKKKILISLVLIIILIILFVIYYFSNIEQVEEIDFSEVILQNEELNNNLNKTNNSEYITGNIIENNIDEDKNKEIVVHITGEVKKEGIVYLKEGDRVIDAIKKAGGETKNADLSQVNLAYVLSDGQKIYIPSKNENIEEYIIEESSENNNRSQTNETKNEKVNINHANETELDTLPGIGPSISKKIIKYREENGKFNNIEDIKNVSGIGDSKYEEIKNYITV